MRISLLILSLFLAYSAQADVYKSVDEEGNVIFSDQASPGAERLEIKEIQTIKAPQSDPGKPAAPTGDNAEKEEKGEKEEPFVYTKVEITSPANDTAVRSNEGNITISVAVEPGLNSTAGDVLILYMDNKQVSKGTGLQFSLKNVDRGTHSVSVAVVDKDGKEIIRSSSISFTILRYSALLVPKPVATDSQLAGSSQVDTGGTTPFPNIQQ